MVHHFVNHQPELRKSFGIKLAQLPEQLWALADLFLNGRRNLIRQQQKLIFIGFQSLGELVVNLETIWGPSQGARKSAQGMAAPSLRCQLRRTERVKSKCYRGSSLSRNEKIHHEITREKIGTSPVSVFQPANIVFIEVTPSDR